MPVVPDEVSKEIADYLGREDLDQPTGCLDVFLTVSPEMLARDGLGGERHLAHHEFVKIHLRARVIYVYAYNVS